MERKVEIILVPDKFSPDDPVLKMLKRKALEFKALIDSGQIPPLEKRESESTDEPGEGEGE